MECPECRNEACHECGHMHGMGAGCYHCWRHGGFKLLRWIIGLMILVFVFWAGFKLGELKSLMFSGQDGRYSLPGGYMMMWHGGQSGIDNGYYLPSSINTGGTNSKTPTSSVR